MKSPAALDEIESKVLMLTDDAKREDLLKMVTAQAKKFQPVAQDAVAKKPEPEKEEAPPVEEVKEAEQPKKTRTRSAPKVIEEAPAAEGQVIEVTITGKTSDEHLKEYSTKLNNAKSKGELNEIHEIFRINEHLTTAHMEQLKKIYEQCKSKFEPNTAADPIKSQNAKGGLKRKIAYSSIVD